MQVSTDVWKDAMEMRINQLSKQLNRAKKKRVTKEKQKSRANCPRLVWGAICFIWCIIQLVAMTELYLSYQMNVETLFMPQDPLIPPNVVLCASNAFKEPCDEVIVWKMNALSNRL